MTQDAKPLSLDDHARFSVAPMMAWTDRHCRYFHRLISKNALLYTEMVTAPALVLGRATRLLDHAPEEHPVALQLGGSDAAQLGEATKIAADHGYHEVNLNVGCPSDRVQSGCFGAVLMTMPDTVRACLDAMVAVSTSQITVKCRIGVDDQNPNEVLPEFLRMVADCGISRVTIHARKAWLKGLSPKENRDIPPLDYDLVHQMKAEFPSLHISLNGGLGDVESCLVHLDRGLDGVMVGRAAYQSPFDMLSNVDEKVFGGSPSPTAVEIGHQMIPYLQNHLEEGGRLHQVTRHMFGLFAGQPGARHWRRQLSVLGADTSAGIPEYSVLLNQIEQLTRDAREGATWTQAS